MAETPKRKNENAKDPAWLTPVELPSVGKHAYDARSETGSGSRLSEAETPPGSSRKPA